LSRETPRTRGDAIPREDAFWPSTTPAGLEIFYRQVGEPVTDRERLPTRTEPDVEALSCAAPQHGIAIVVPPPRAYGGLACQVQR
jgi:hypothetical protein